MLGPMSNRYAIAADMALRSRRGHRAAGNVGSLDRQPSSHHEKRQRFRTAFFRLCIRFLACWFSSIALIAGVRVTLTDHVDVCAKLVGGDEHPPRVGGPTLQE